MNWLIKLHGELSIQIPGKPKPQLQCLLLKWVEKHHQATDHRLIYALYGYANGDSLKFKGDLEIYSGV